MLREKMPYKSHDQHPKHLVTFHPRILINNTTTKNMQSTLTLLFMTSIIVVVKSQTWTGTYSASGNTCDTSQCCCFSGTVVVSQYSTSNLLITSDLSGACNGASTASVYFPTPNGYTTSITLYGATTTLTLSSNSQTLNATDIQTPACSGSITKSGATSTQTPTYSGAIKQHANIMMLFVIALLGMAMRASNM
jgi:hypothetical protein